MGREELYTPNKIVRDSASHPPSFLCFSFSFSFSLTVPTDQGRNFENALGGLATFFSAESLNICLKLRLYKKALKMTDYQLFFLHIIKLVCTLKQFWHRPPSFSRFITLIPKQIFSEASRRISTEIVHYWASFFSL